MSPIFPRNIGTRLFWSKAMNGCLLDRFMPPRGRLMVPLVSMAPPLPETDEVTCTGSLVNAATTVQSLAVSVTV